VNLGTTWGRLVEKTGDQKSRATVPLRNRLVPVCGNIIVRSEAIENNSALKMKLIWSLNN
jgi:hypothetical protein